MMPVINEADEKVITENFCVGGEDGDEAISIIESTTAPTNWDEHN